jgi:kumamolisin
MLAALAVTLWAHAAPHSAMTLHVPEPVARGSAPLVGVPAPGQTMELSISLPLRNEDELRSLVRVITSPASPEYRHYLSVAEFTARYGPSFADYRSLVRWAVEHNLHPHPFPANRRILDVQSTVSDVERAFHVRIGIYRHPSEGRTFYAPDREPSLDLAQPVLHISGLDDYAQPVSHLVRGEVPEGTAKKPTGSGPDGNFIGSDIRAAYYGGTALTGTGQSLGLFEFAGYNLADVRRYFQKVGQLNDVPIVGVSLNGANLECKDKCNDGEQALDMEEALSMAPGLKQLVVYVGHYQEAILNQMASDDTSAQLSCSWGWGPDAAELDPIFEEFAAQGQSFLVATGDDGYLLKQGVVWPADDQLATAVGGTDLTTIGPGGAWLGETGWYYSGGGPSPDGIPIPDFQKPFVTAQNKGSRELRNVPDIAGDAQVDNYSCFVGGCYTGNGGTSYAAPLWAGFIALANQFAAASGKPSIGFLNTPIYAIGGTNGYEAAFHDEIKGYNGRYAAGPGFDLVTGFGSPNGEATIKALVRGR